jgi:hypothetical protein
LLLEVPFQILDCPSDQLLQNNSFLPYSKRCLTNTTQKERNNVSKSS